MKLMEAEILKLVEAMGIEPMSALSFPTDTTCLFFEYIHLQPQRHSFVNESVL